MSGERAGVGGDMAGRFISLEGIDASGKSTLALALAERLAADGRPVMLLDRHTATDHLTGYLGDHLAGLRALIWDYPPDAVTSRLGFGHWSHLIGAWFHAVDHTVVRPALSAGRWLVADSWFYKFAARFALSVGTAGCLAPFDGVLRPHAVIWLDVPPERCLARRSELRRTERGEWQGLDGGDRAFVEYQGRVREVYRELSRAHEWIRAEAGGARETAAWAHTQITAAASPATMPPAAVLGEETP